MNWWDLAQAVADILTPNDLNTGEDQVMHAFHEGYQAGELHQHQIDQQHDYPVHQQYESSHPADHGDYGSGHSVSDGLGGSY